MVPAFGSGAAAQGQQTQQTDASDIKVESDVVYGKGGDLDLRLDIYRPLTGTEKRMAVIRIHGGGFTQGSKTGVASSSRAFARQGYVSIASQYRLTGQGRWPAQIEDVKAAIRWTRANASMLNIDPARVAVAGYSDLPLAACFTAAALALMRWTRERGIRNAAVAVVLAVACTQIKNPGWFWAATLVPAAIVVLLPRHGVRVSMIAFAAVAFMIAAVARMKLSLFNYRLDLDFDPPWRDLFQSYFLLGNWNLLWFGVVAIAAFAYRDLLSRRLVP